MLILASLLVLTGCVAQPVKQSSAKKTASAKSVKPPSLTVTQPTPGFETEQTQLQIVGKTDPGAYIRLDGAKMNTQPDGSFSIGVELVTGMNMFVVTAVSKKGASVEQELSVNCTAKRVLDLAPDVSDVITARDASTPAKALLGHWHLDETQEGGDVSEWYFDGENLRIYIENDNLLLSPQPYTIVVEDMEVFSVIIDFGDDFGTMVASFSADRQRATFTFEGEKPFPIAYVDMKIKP